MSIEEKNIDKIFRDRLRNFDAEPPVEVWSNIKDTLYLERRKRTILWIARVAAGIAVLIALSVGFFIIRKPAADKLISVDKAKVENDSSITVISELNPGENIPSTVKSKELKKQPQEIRYPKTVPDIAVLSQEEKLDYLRGKSIRQVDIYLTGPGTVLLYNMKVPGASQNDLTGDNNPEEDLYALNIIEENQRNENRWAVGTEVSPLYTYRNIDGQNKQAMALADNYNQSESGILAYSGGVNVNYSPLRRLSVQSGVYYSRYGVNVNNAYVIEDATAAASRDKIYSINYSSGKMDIESNPSVNYITNISDHKYHFEGSSNFDQFSQEVNSGEITQNFEYIEVPLVLRYRVIDRKIGFNLLGGLSTNLLVGSNIYYSSDGEREKIGKTTDIKPFNYSSIVGLGVDYSVSKHLIINLEPTFRYYLNSINQSSVIKSYPYSIGVFTGLTYNF